MFYNTLKIRGLIINYFGNIDLSSPVPATT